MSETLKVGDRVRRARWARGWWAHVLSVDGDTALVEFTTGERMAVYTGGEWLQVEP